MTVAIARHRHNARFVFMNYLFSRMPEDYLASVLGHNRFEMGRHGLIASICSPPSDRAEHFRFFDGRLADVAEDPQVQLFKS
jgi:hypothetical protein